MSRAGTWKELMDGLHWVYAKEHSFTFFINGDSAGARFAGLTEWEQQAAPEMKANYQNGQYVLTNLWVYSGENKMEYIAHQLRDGRVVSQDLVVASLVREDGHLRYKHIDIYYQFTCATSTDARLTPAVMPAAWPKDR